MLLRPGDRAVARGPEPYTVADLPDTEPRARIGPGGTCTTLHGEPLSQSMDLGVRTWGNAPDGSTTVLVGTYLLDGEISGRLLDALPPLLVLPSGGKPGTVRRRCSTTRSRGTSRARAWYWTACWTSC